MGLQMDSESVKLDMNIVVLLDKYYPIKSANSLCISNITRMWSEQYNDRISVICFGEKDYAVNLADEEVCVVSCTPRKKWIECTTIPEKIRYIDSRVKTLFTFPRIDRQIVNQYVKALVQISETHPVDCVISLCNPAESVEAGFIYKEVNPKTKWIIYDIDTVSNRSLGKIDSFFSIALMARAYHWECRMFGSADHVIHLQQHAEHFRSSKYRAFMQKTTYLDLPLLDITVNEGQAGSKSERDEMTLLYAGRFYRNLREPWNMLEIVFNKNNTAKTRTLIYTEHAYVSKLRERYSEMKNLNLSDYVSEAEINQKMMEADYLLSVGNAATVMFPSKIITYVSTGKPIIHFFSNDQDPVIPYLEHYPEALLLDTRKPLAENVAAFNAFIEKAHPRVSSAILREQYRSNIPEVSAEKMRALICRQS